ncbi:MAG: hypothetical protein L3J07_01160 [Candidatus Magasanikbacteria bacterium]|nr:hypothetical protein [Candidatus Magasanikbacteria bacterium]
MLFSKNYRRPFWRGFTHAIAVVFYCLFVSTMLLSFDSLFNGEIASVIQVTFGLFLFVVSASVIAYLIFFEPMKKTIHKSFKAASVMLMSTFGWLFVFLSVFIIGLVYTL